MTNAMTVGLLAALIDVALHLVMMLLREEIKSSYTGVVIRFESTVSVQASSMMPYSVWIVIKTFEHSAGTKQVLVSGFWVSRRYRVGDQVQKAAGELWPRTIRTDVIKST
jgi:hypothetical protein